MTHSDIIPSKITAIDEIIPAKMQALVIIGNEQVYMSYLKCKSIYIIASWFISSKFGKQKIINEQQ